MEHPTRSVGHRGGVPRALEPQSSAESRTADQHDAWTVATRLRDADLQGDLDTYLEPCLTPDERKVADIEGWILGVA